MAVIPYGASKQNNFQGVKMSGTYNISIMPKYRFVRVVMIEPKGRKS